MTPKAKALIYTYDDSEVYDWIVDIDLITNISSFVCDWSFK